MNKPDVSDYALFCAEQRKVRDLHSDVLHLQEALRLASKDLSRMEYQQSLDEHYQELLASTDLPKPSTPTGEGVEMPDYTMAEAGLITTLNEENAALKKECTQFENAAGQSFVRAETAEDRAEKLERERDIKEHVIVQTEKRLREVEIERDQARRRAESLWNDLSLGMSQGEHLAPLEWGMDGTQEESSAEEMLGALCACVEYWPDRPGVQVKAGSRDTFWYCMTAAFRRYQ